ncbi:PAS domain S-box protein [candidate division KSB1 bacterium]|nr:PAS domain S-box protein [candidate division KSB1 bacterium]
MKHIKPKQPIRIVSEEEKLFRNIFRYSNDAIFVIDPNIDKILDVNPKACDMLGYSYEELLSSPISAIHSQEISKFLGFTDSVMRSGHGRTSELTFLCKTGDTLQSEISASPMIIDDQKCIVAIVSDISERKKAEEKLKRAENRIEFEKTKLEEVLSIEESLNGILNLDELITYIVDKATNIRY